MQVKVEWEEGQFAVREEDEDIHAANERRLSVHINLIKSRRTLSCFWVDRYIVGGHC